MNIRISRRPTWLHFIAWALTGAAAALSILGTFTIGPLVVPLAVLLTGITLLLGGGNVSAVGALAGPGLLCLAIGWLNRHEMDPVGWYAAGTVFVAAAVAIFVVKRRGVS